MLIKLEGSFQGHGTSMAGSVVGRSKETDPLSALLIAIILTLAICQLHDMIIALAK